MSLDGNEAACGALCAGQSSGHEGVRDAIELLGADRIDQGVPAIEDRALMALLVERQIPLGICPTAVHDFPKPVFECALIR